jgi:hypothetical protein
MVGGLVVEMAIGVVVFGVAGILWGLIERVVGRRLLR